MRHPLAAAGLALVTLVLAGCASSGAGTAGGGRARLAALTVRVGVTGGPAIGPSGQSAVVDAPKQGVQVRASAGGHRYAGRTEVHGIVVLHVLASATSYRITVPSCSLATSRRITGPPVTVHLDCQVP